MKKKLRMEELEERIAPTVIAAGESLTWDDANDDSVTVEYNGPDGSQVDILNTLAGDIDDGDDIGTITFTGASLESELIITADGAGGNDIVIEGGISAPGAQDVGTISIGIEDGGAEAGEAALGTGFSLDVGGALGTVFLNGDFDCDTMNQSITAGGDIGALVFLGNLHLEAGTGLLDVAAGGAGGAGNISFVYLADAPYIGSGTGTLMNPEMFTTTSGAIADDAGDGTIGTINLKLSGPSPAAGYWAVPVVGGGNVLAHVAVSSPDAKLTIATSGVGGDVASVAFQADAVGLYVTGAADTDVLEVMGDGDIGTVSDRTVGGDIGIVDSTGDVGTIQTGKLGNLGGIYTGAGNSMPAFDCYDFVDDGTVVDGAIAKINVGSINEGDIEAASIGTITAKHINWTHISVTNDISSVKADGVYDSCIFASGALGKISVGAQGVVDSMIQGFGGIDSVSVKGLIVDSTISSQYLDGGGNQIGGAIGSIKADAIFYSRIAAVGSIDKIAVKGAFMDSNIDTRWFDSSLSQWVGGGIGAVSIGGIYNLDVDCYANIGTLKVGAGGMRQGSSWYINGNVGVGSVQVSGDIVDSEIDLNGTLGTLKVSGNMMEDAYIGADVINSVNISGSIAGALIEANSAGKISVKGDIYGDYNSIGSPAIYVGGDVTSIAVGGGIFLPSEDTAIEVTGTTGSLTVQGDLYSADLDLGNVTKLSLGGVTYYSVIDVDGNLQQLGTKAVVDSDISVTGDFATAKVNGDLLYVDIEVDGSVGTLSIGGDVMDSDIEIEGAALGTLSIKGDVMSSDIDTGDWGVSATTAGTISLGGSVIKADMDIYGPLANLSVKGQAYDLGITGSDALTKIAFSKSVTNTSIYTVGAVSSMSVGGNAYDSTLRAESGIGSVAVKGNLVGSGILAQDYDGSGDPVASNIGSVSAAAMYNSGILATGDISSVNVKGVIQDSKISAVGYDGYGSGDVVSGGSISSLKAAGLVDSYVEAYTDIQAIQLGAYGVDYQAGISTITGDLAGLTTKGLIYGQINVGGDLTGNVSSAGNDALLYEDTYYFTDANGGLTEGTMEVGGIVAPGVTVS